MAEKGIKKVTSEETTKVLKTDVSAEKVYAEPEEKFYSLRNDFMFHMVFQENERALKALVAVLMGMSEGDIKECRIENPITPGMQIDTKSCVLDILLTLNNERHIDIEMQVAKDKNWHKRSLFYWSRMYDDLKSGADYGKLKPAVQIAILNFTLFEDEPAFYAEYKILNTDSYRLFSDDLSIRILDLTQTDKAIPGKDDELKKWASMFNANSRQELEAAAGEKEVFRDMAKTMEEITKNPEYRTLVDGRDKYNWDMRSQYDTGKEDGIIEGRKAGIAEGRTVGIAEGRKSGIAEGRTAGITEGVESTVKQLAAALGKDENELRELLKSQEN